MPYNKNTDRVFRRILSWLFIASVAGLALYFFYPSSSEPPQADSDNYETQYDSASEEDDSNPDDTALSPDDETQEQVDDKESDEDEQVDASIAPEFDHSEQEIDDQGAVDSTTDTAKPSTESTTSKPQKDVALNGFIKHVRHFSNANNFWIAIKKSDFNPALIAQLEPLKKHLSWRSNQSVDILYSNYYSDGEYNPDNSKILMVRGNAKRNGWTFYAREQHGKSYLYDSEGEAPEPSMNRTPINYTRITSPFNLHRRHPITGRISPHEGVDLKQAYGTPVKSTGDGIVTFAGNQHGYGRIVMIHHPNGYETRYAHLSAIKVSRGQKVKRGDVIGKLGNSGISTGAHVHYEVRINGVAHDPMKIKLPSYNPISRRDLQTWRFRTAQYREEMMKLLKSH